jgi:lipopolysaccharide/colanic/teichoic acid biosynthesis glycosyltransferase
MMIVSESISLKKRKNRILFNFAIDLFSVFLSTMILTAANPKTLKYVTTYYFPQTLFFILFVLVSILLNKYEFKERKGFYFILNRFVIAWLISSVIAFSVVELTDANLRNKLLIYWFLLFFFFELLFYIISYAFRHAQDLKDAIELNHKTYVLNSILMEKDMTEITEDEMMLNIFEKTDIPSDLDIIKNEKLREFIHNYSYKKRNKRLLLNTHSRFNIQSYPGTIVDQIVNLRRVNNINYINKFFETVYTKLRKGGIFILSVETIDLRKKRFRKRYLFLFSWLIRLFDYIIHRIWPRMPYIRKMYFAIWKKTNRRLSYAETLGRLYSCGFEYLSEIESEGRIWFAVRKRNIPVFDFNATYGPIIKLRRIGKNGEDFHVYKFRTMHPFSEYLQEFVYKRNALDKSGKFRDDFRVTTIGKFMRRTWLDEIPMFINLLKGDIKLVGVRPLSKHFLGLYPEEFRAFRNTFKPGLIPPFYYDLPDTFEKIIESEKKYLESYSKFSLGTDIRYFFKACWNIIFRRARSK